MSITDPYANLGGAFEAQKKQAAMAQLLSQDQLKQVLSTYDPTKNIALAQRTAQAQGAYPELTTQVNASGLGEGILKGLSAGVGNIQQLRAYGQNVQAQRDIQQQALQAQAKERELVLGNIAAEQQRSQQAGGVLPQPVRDIYSAMPSDARNAYLTQYGNQQLDNANIEPQQAAKTRAEIAANQAELDDKATRFKAISGKTIGEAFAGANAGVTTPQTQNAYAYTYGKEFPADALTDRKRQAEADAAVQGVRSTAINNQTLGRRNEAGLEGSLLRNSMEKVQLKYEDTLKQLDMQAAQGKASDSNIARKNLQDAKARYDTVSAHYDELTPEQIRILNSGFKSLGTPFELPEKTPQNLRAVTKGGEVTQFYNPMTGQVVKPKR